MKPSEIAKNCKTTKEAREMFKTLCKDMDRKEAQNLIKRACELINKRNEAAKKDNDNARGWLKEYDNILKSVFVEYVKSAEFKKAYKGARFNGNAIDFIRAFYPYLTKSGCPVVVRYEFISGVRFKRYEKMNKTRAAVFAVLDTCTKSIYRNRLGQFLITTRAARLVLLWIDTTTRAKNALK